MTTTRRHRTTTTARRDTRGHGTRRWVPAIRSVAWTPRGLIVLDRSFAARLDLKPAVIDAVCDQLIPRGWVVESDRPWLVLCLDESFTNAVLHGCEGDPRLSVQVVVANDGKRWQVAFHDPGTGFAAEAIPDPEDPASLLLEHGRGIRLMRSWLSSLVYYRGGATVVMSRPRADL